MKNKRIIAALLCLTLLCSCLAACSSSKESEEKNKAAAESEFIQPEYDKQAEKVTKTETVYVNLDSYGKASLINVSDWLHTDESEVYADDKSDLKDVQNLKSNVEPVMKDGALRWNMPETDLYYGGTSEKELPLSFDISYKLDGKSIAPEKLAGKSGDVEITIKVTNNEFKDVKVNGVTRRVYLPLVVVGGMILSEQTFSAIEVGNGQSIGDGSKEICLFMGMPGFSESLGIENEDVEQLSGLSIGNTFTVKARADKFKLGNIYFAALPIGSLNFDFALPDSVDDLKSLFAALKAFQTTLNEIDPNGLIMSLLSDEEKVTELMSALTKTLSLYSGNKELIEVLVKYATPENTEALTSLINSLSDPEMKDALEALSDPRLQIFFRRLPELSESFKELSPVLEDMQKDLEKPEVAAQLENLPETIESLKEIANLLSENSETFSVLSSVLRDDGTKVLESLIENIDLSSLTSLGEKYSSLAQDGDLIIELADEWLEFGKEYRLYTDCGEGFNYSLAFVFNTPSIAVAESETEEKEEAVELPWYKKLFG